MLPAAIRLSTSIFCSYDTYFPIIPTYLHVLIYFLHFFQILESLSYLYSGLDHLYKYFRLVLLHLILFFLSLSYFSLPEALWPCHAFFFLSTASCTSSSHHLPRFLLKPLFSLPIAPVAASLIQSLRFCQHNSIFPLPDVAV